MWHPSPALAPATLQPCQQPKWSLEREVRSCRGPTPGLVMSSHSTPSKRPSFCSDFHHGLSAAPFTSPASPPLTLSWPPSSSHTGPFFEPQGGLALPPPLPGALRCIAHPLLFLQVLLKSHPRGRPTLITRVNSGTCPPATTYSLSPSSTFPVPSTLASNTAYNLFMMFFMSLLQPQRRSYQMFIKTQGKGDRQIRVQILPLPCIPCLICVSYLNLPEAPFPHL